MPLSLFFLVGLVTNPQIGHVAETTLPKPPATQYRLPPSAKGPGIQLKLPAVSARSSPGISDSIRVLAIRVEFQPDNVSTTTGNGTFDLSTPQSTVIDPPPHDRPYFEAQLLALSNYFRSASGGKLVIVGEVYPVERTSAYRLPHPMVYYHPPEASSDPSLRDRRLAELLRDAVALADADSSVHFEGRDCVIVFHAGVGQDFAFDFDPTPNDIPSAFLDSTTLASALAEGQPWSGIPVEGGSQFVKEGILLPETQSQEGYQIGLLGTACLLFGSWLGLPALWNTDDGSPGIGMWGLMDQGSGNGSGLLPAYPCAWSRVFLGWCEPIVIDRGDHLPVAAWKARDPHKIYKIPINDHEYFLIENRQRDVNRDGIALGRDVHGNRVELKFDSNGRLQILHEGTLGVITQVDEYDFGLPGSGILIWHIDEEVLRRHLASNRVNADPNHRAVDLEEADGAQDIGQSYGLLSPGSGSQSGVPEDAFWSGNQIHKLVNNSAEVAFTPYTEPNSHSYSGAASQVFVTNFSDLDSVMFFSVRREGLKQGFPVHAGAELEAPPLVADLDDDGADEIVAATRDGRLCCWRGDGRPFLPTDQKIGVVGVGHDTTWYPDATFFRSNATERPLNPVLGRNAYGPLLFWGVGRRMWALVPQADGPSNQAVLLPDSVDLPQGHPLRSWVRADGTALTLYPRRGFLRFVELAPDLSPLVLEAAGPESLFDAVFVSAQGCFVVDGNGKLCAYDADLQLRWSARLADGPAHLGAGDLEGDGIPELVALSARGVVDVWTAEGVRAPGFPSGPFGPCSGWPVLGDIDGLGGFEIAFVTEDGHAYVLDRGGLPLRGWPVPLRWPGTGTTGGGVARSVTPVLVDLDGDGAADLLAPDGEGRLHALRSDGRSLPGFPLATSTAVAGIAVGDTDGDGLAELVVAGSEGLIYSWDTSAPTTAASWPHPLADAYATGVARGGANPPRPPSGAGTLLVAGSAHCYPNPTGGQQAHLRFTLKKGAEVKVEIFDLAGRKVAEVKGQGRGGLENELLWNTKDVAPGVYFARLTAKAQGASESAIVKIAVTP